MYGYLLIQPIIDILYSSISLITFYVSYQSSLNVLFVLTKTNPSNPFVSEASYNMHVVAVKIKSAILLS